MLDDYSGVGTQGQLAIISAVTDTEKPLDHNYIVGSVAMFGPTLHQLNNSIIASTLVSFDEQSLACDPPDPIQLEEVSLASGHNRGSLNKVSWEGVKGNVVLVQRGLCTFFEKVKNFQQFGAIAVIVVDNNPNQEKSSPILPLISMTTSTDHQDEIVIPSFFISQEDGQLLREHIGEDGLLISISPAQSISITVEDQQSCSDSSTTEGFRLLKENLQFENIKIEINPSLIIQNHQDDIQQEQQQEQQQHKKNLDGEESQDHQDAEGT